MKIRWFDRLLLVVTSLFLLAQGAVIGMLALDYGRDVFYHWSELMFGHTINRVILCVIAVLLALIALRMLFMRPKRDNSAQSMIFMCTTDAGTVRILPEAVDAIVQRAARGNQHVRDLKTKVMPIDETLHVQLRVMIAPGVLVKDVSVELQKMIKEELEKQTGIPVPEVQVIIEATPNTPARVE